MRFKGKKARVTLAQRKLSLVATAPEVALR